MNKNLIATALTVGLFASPAMAQDEWSLSLDGYVGVTTDYRDRGLSLSDRDFAAVVSVGAFFDNGFYAGVDAGTVDTANGGDARLELFAGYSLDTGGYVYDFSVEVDSIHGDSSQYYPEFKASISRDFGLAFTRAGVAYAPGGRWVNPNNQSFYSFADLEIPVPNMPSLTIIGHVGRDFRSDIENLWDWSVGLSAFVGDAELSVTYDKSSFDGRIGSGRVIVGARMYF
ncbi:MAG: hypothetical protein JJ850_01325 [Kordiimonadaceae bacterium]|nr:hypothetical protein [Kordiimonadaceae bacterium]MBO6567558.1 hypothetical protein [Kordiimonadaceae bacterium]MBO6963228.1 hypothetical protein [Kordiimonadaceae bacterium]